MTSTNSVGGKMRLPAAFGSRSIFCFLTSFPRLPTTPSSFPCLSSTKRYPVLSPRPYAAAAAFTSAAGDGASSSSWPPLMERQFEELRTKLEESGALRDRIREAVVEMDSAIRLMHFNVLLVHQSLPVAQVVEKAEVQIGVLKEQFKRLAEILRECPGQYYRYHGDWKSETQSAVSLMTFLHWLETGSLLLHHEAEEKLGLNSTDFGLDVEDYLIGLCFMSNDLPRYVVNQVTAGDYDCPKRVLRFLTDLHACFRMLTLRNDFLRKKFDSLKYDQRKVEEVFYDVKIRGLATSGLEQERKPAPPTRVDS